ncbi:porimin [Meles meles]|uniref:porimin n=1 Tax=Meles meles TaxID=9662 RepID=UPI001E69FAC7|nr:porimin [Meles meles]
MGVGARGVWAALILGALLVLALLKAAVDPAGLDGSVNTKNLVPPGNQSTDPPENVTTVTSNHTSQPTSTMRRPTPPQSSVAKTEAVTAVTSTATARITTPVGSANRTHTGSVPQNTTQTKLASVTTPAHNSSVTSVSSSVTLTPTINSTRNPGSKFDVGSFLGGIVLTLGVLSLLYVGCRTYYSRRGIRYRTIDEHDAII